MVIEGDKFNIQKHRAMQKFEFALSKDEVDKALVGFLKKFNNKKFYYTSSSCAGRIILLHDLGCKKYSYFVARWHKKVKVEEVLDNIIKFCDGKDRSKGILLFRQEPIIMHIVAYDLEHAKGILEISVKNGLKHSGIIALSNERCIVEINGNERMSVPLVYDNKLLIEKKDMPQYLSSIIDIANKNFEKNEKRREKFSEEILKI
ncbi:conserved hypothetical protein [groundwater metagenome]|uniref:tRNA(Phe) 7-((3-amino-3-carboxypropyl)-4-demethylwyosine(37)-N(4))-methyltransferase n=1 Tax=groundwater metagenome TaxID=717931 RepID=A0A098EAY9_9ZZZZ